MTKLRDVLDAKISERDFQQLVIDYARLNGYLAYHTHDSRRSAAGFPDLVLARAGKPGRYGRDFLIVELKAERGRVRPEQLEWIGVLDDVGIETRIWRPSDWPQIEARLAR